MRSTAGCAAERGGRIRLSAALLVAAVALIAVAGCSARTEQPATQERASSQFVVLGSDPTTAGPAPAMPGLAANSIPREALRHIPGAGEIAVASGTPLITREQAIEKSRPGTGTFVSAVDVLLPVKFMRSVLNDPKKAKPTTAWVVTWTGVRQVSSGPAGKGADGKPLAGRIRHGNTTTVLDATTGAKLLVSEYAGRP